MSQILDLEPPARQIERLAGKITDDQLAARTPCTEATVGDLLSHVMGLTVALRDAAAKQKSEFTGPPPAPGPLAADWRGRLPERLAALVAAWRKPEAWEGMTEAGGLTLPGEIAGLVALDELVIHGWDLASATGQPFECDPASTQATYSFLSSGVEPDQRGNRNGIFGPVVEVSPDAPLLDRAVGLSGRDPSWTP